jgi:hypothetical protein
MCLQIREVHFGVVEMWRGTKQFKFPDFSRLRLFLNLRVSMQFARKNLCIYL